jgi:transcriptional regulator GlxA family with amidase domain
MTIAAFIACRDRRIERVLLLVSRDLTRRPPLTEAARIAGLAPTYFAKCFRQNLGVTFVEWSSHVRIDEAKRLLGIADLSITAVAAAVGYEDVTTFERVFRRFESTCPRQYRRLINSGPNNTRNAEFSARNAETTATDGV